VAHFLPGLGNALDMSLDDIGWWYAEGVKLHKEMNEVPDNG